MGDDIPFNRMKTWEKIAFWATTLLVLSDSLIWQWRVKLSEEPIVSLPFPFWIGYKNLIGDAIVAAVWLVLAIRIYRRVNQK